MRIDDLPNIREKGFDGTELVEGLLFSHLEGGLRHGCSTADLHAGNSAGRRLWTDRPDPDHGPYRPAHPLVVPASWCTPRW